MKRQHDQHQRQYPHQFHYQKIKNISWYTLLILVLLVMFSLPTLATERQEDPDEAVVRDIAQGLRCAVCQNQPIYESNSDLAKDMLKIIRQQVRDGRQPSEIRQYFHDRYGDYIYLEPTRAGSNMILWAGPFLLLLGGVGILLVALRRWRSARPLAGGKRMTPAQNISDIPSHANPASMTDQQRRIRQELERVDL
ncbi:MAG: cytochrome c-type biogenesis protein CcmH [Magnetococcus sp. DMHC-1]|nr:cytochrome c-type biogenesis protein CcmH [Magnetococcales bacterium]